MSQKWLIALLIILVAFLGWKLLATPAKPPMPTVRYHNEEVEVLQGSYQWKTIGKTVLADSPTPPELVKNITPTIITLSTAEPEGNLKVSFSYKPKTIEVRTWQHGEPTPYNIDHGTIIVPKESGTYIFEIIGTWPQGQSRYAFIVVVK